jgi:hypothetical protein
MKTHAGLLREDVQAAPRSSREAEGCTEASQAQGSVARSSTESDVAEQERMRNYDEDAKLEHQTLLKTIQERGLKVTGTLPKDLREAIHRDDLEKEHQLEVEKRKERAAKIKEGREAIYTDLFQRNFKADPTRMPLMDLPAEVRVRVYKYRLD